MNCRLITLYRWFDFAIHACKKLYLALVLLQYIYAKGQKRGNVDLIKGNDDLITGNDDLIKGNDDLITGNDYLIQVNDDLLM